MSIDWVSARSLTLKRLAVCNTVIALAASTVCLGSIVCHKLANWCNKPWSINTDCESNISIQLKWITTMAEFRREPMGVVGRELREEPALNSSELRLSEPSLKPLLMELLSSQLQRKHEKYNHCTDSGHNCLCKAIKWIMNWYKGTYLGKHSISSKRARKKTCTTLTYSSATLSSQSRIFMKTKVQK